MSDGSPPAGPVVLVVEDNGVNQALVAEQLARLGATAVVVGDGAEALDLLATGRQVDLVLMDFQLPGEDGVAVTRRIRAGEGPGTRLPIVGMTASAREDDRHRCLAAGMDDLAVKPVALAELGAVLRRWAGTSGGADADGPAAPSSGPVDLGALDRLAEDLGSTAPVRSIVETYLTELAKRRSAIAEAAAAGDHDTVRRTAHTLRSTSRTLGASGLDAVAERVEAADPSADAELLAELDRCAQATRDALEGWLSGAPASTR